MGQHWSVAWRGQSQLSVAMGWQSPTVMARLRAPSTHLWMRRPYVSTSTTLVSQSLWCDTAIAERIHFTYGQISEIIKWDHHSMSAFGPIIKPLWHSIRKAQDQVQQVQREVYYTRSTFGIISSTRASGPSRLEQYVNEDGSSSDAKPSASSSALMAPTEKFFKFIFNNVAFINLITNLQASHFQIGSLHV